MTETVRSVARSLHLMATLNRNNGASLNWLAKATGLSRGTTYRMLETFVTEGFAIKDAASRGYWLTETVQSLSDGYAATGWITSIVQPRLDALGREVVWPLSLCVPSGTDMIVKTTTDLDTPLTMELVSAGLRMPMTASSAGHAYLAHCSDEERRVIVDLIHRTSGTVHTSNMLNAKDQSWALKGVRDAGFSALEGTHRVSNIAVPILIEGSVLACIVLRFYTSAMSMTDAIQSFKGPLKVASNDIAESYKATHDGHTEL